MLNGVFEFCLEFFFNLNVCLWFQSPDQEDLKELVDASDKALEEVWFEFFDQIKWKREEKKRYLDIRANVNQAFECNPQSDFEICFVWTRFIWVSSDLFASIVEVGF